MYDCRVRSRFLAFAVLALSAATGACTASFPIVLPDGSAGTTGWSIAVRPTAGALRVEWIPLEDVTDYSLTLVSTSGGTPVVTPVVCSNGFRCAAEVEHADDTAQIGYELTLGAGSVATAPTISVQAIPSGWNGVPAERGIVIAGPDDPDDSYGAVMGAAGDVNGDGHGDFVVTGSYYDTRGSTDDLGIAHVYFGGPDGAPSTPGWARVGPGNLDYLGLAFANVGDRNGDGLDDFALGMPLNFTGETAPASLQLFGSVPSGTPTPLPVVPGGQTNAQFGHAIASGEFDAIAGRDILVSEWFWDQTVSDRGRVLAILNGASTTTTWVDGPSTIDAKFGAHLVGLGNVLGDSTEEWGVVQEAGTDAGASIRSGTGLPSYSEAGADYIAPAGDVDGDGWADVLIATQGASVTLHRGGSGGVQAARSLAAGSFGGDLRFGHRVCSANLNGDRHSDVIVMDPNADPFDPDLGSIVTDAGRALVFYGGKGSQGIDATETFTIIGSANEKLMRCASAGDLDGDGSDEVLLAGLDGRVHVIEGVPGAGPRISLDAYSPAGLGDSVTLEGLTVAGDSPPFECTIDWGDESGAETTDCQTPTHEYAEPDALHDVSIRARDARGFEARALLQLGR